MARHHLVEQGEHLSGIAEKYGFADYHTIWDHPENAKLKQQRENPNVLAPRDDLFIPDWEEQEYPRSTEQQHKFRMEGQGLNLVLRLERSYEAPIAHAKC